MKIVEGLRRVNRTLLEMYLGMLFIGLVCQIIGVFAADNKLRYTVSLWFGILTAAVSVRHLYRTLDSGLDYDEKTATKLIFRGYVLRYVGVAILLLVIAMTDVLNILVVFMGYMTLKVTALIQPLTHKLCNKMFHETDPVAQPMEDAAQEPISSE